MEPGECHSVSHITSTPTNETSTSELYKYSLHIGELNSGGYNGALQKPREDEETNNLTRMEVGATVFFWFRVGHVLLHSLNYVTQFLCEDSVDF